MSGRYTAPATSPSRCPTLDKWACLVYKGESYVRYPKSCLACNYHWYCVEAEKVKSKVN